MKTKVIGLIVFALLVSGIPAQANQPTEAERYLASQTASPARNLCYDQKDPAIKLAHDENSRIWNSLPASQTERDERDPSTALGASLVRWMNLKADREVVCGALYNEAYNNALAALIAARPVPTPTPTPTPVIGRLGLGLLNLLNLKSKLQFDRASPSAVPLGLDADDKDDR